jgi:protein-arginine kinase activator protein McsA
MNLDNYIQEVFIGSINIMKTDKWHWPSNWDEHRKLKFLNDSLSYASENEFWEQAAIIRDVKETITKDSPGAVSGDTAQ